ncbi:hypothetical protein ACIF80_12440 [Streptomyces sp. NPDC085927]
MAYACPVAGGLEAVTAPVQVRDPSRPVEKGEASVDDVATELRRGSE